MSDPMFSAAQPDPVFLRLGHLSAFELQVSFLIYDIYQRYQKHLISLPCAGYVTASILEDLSFCSTEERSALSKSPEQLHSLLDNISDCAQRLSALYSSEVFKNIYLVRWVSMHIDAQYQTVTLKQLASELNVNGAYLCSVVSENTGCTFRDMVFYRRLFAFTELVLSNAASVLENAAPKLGYNSIHHFSKIVKHHIGLTPSILRRNLLLIANKNTKF